MSIPTRTQWTKARDAAGGTSGDVKGVSVGGALDAYHNAVAKDGVVGSIRPLGLLETTLKTYHAGVAKKKPKVAAVVQTQLLSEVDRVQKDILKVAKLPRDIEAGCVAIEKLISPKDWTKDRQKVAGVIRLIRAAVDQLVKIDPSNRLAQMHRMTVLAHQEVEKVDKAVGAASDKLSAVVDTATRNITDALKVIRKYNTI